MKLNSDFAVVTINDDISQLLQDNAKVPIAMTGFITGGELAPNFSVEVSSLVHTQIENTSIPITLANLIWFELRAIVPTLEPEAQTAIRETLDRVFA